MVWWRWAPWALVLPWSTDKVQRSICEASPHGLQSTLHPANECSMTQLRIRSQSIWMGHLRKIHRSHDETSPYPSRAVQYSADWSYVLRAQAELSPSIGSIGSPSCSVIHRIESHPDAL